jgi:micrococcal nuclease
VKKLLLPLALLTLGFGAWLKFRPPALTVTKVIDGDTIELSDGRTIRYIGVDTPEMEDECFAKEAKEINENLVFKKTIKVATDKNEMDQFGRTLAYVYVDGLFVNQDLLSKGAGKYFLDNLNTKYSPILVKASEESYNNKSGLWRKCAPDSDGCSIKGNIDRLDHRWYHLPNFRHYSTAIVNLEHGDQWFCTETEAQKAGFEKARE